MSARLTLRLTGTTEGRVESYGPSALLLPFFTQARRRPKRRSSYFAFSPKLRLRR
jgi:hypothetical protein